MTMRVPAFEKSPGTAARGPLVTAQDYRAALEFFGSLENSKMKKTFVAAAVLGAFAGSAFAADVTLYGVVDLGLHYQNVKADGESGVNKFDMMSGQNSGSRFGLKGQEDLGFAKVGFVLENGFDADTGELSKYNEERTRIFGREALLYMTGDFGTLGFGRTGALTAGTGSYNLAKYTPFSTGWGSLTAQKKYFWLGDRDRMDNSVTYVTPSFAGFQVSAQYSFKRAGTEAAGNERQNDRYAAIGASYNNGPFSSALVVDTVFYNYADTKAGKKADDSLGVTLGASYDFEVVKLFAQAQYGKNEKKLGASVADFEYGSSEDKPKEDWAEVSSNKGWKGYGITLGATAPVLGGTLYAQANYLDAKAKDVEAAYYDSDENKKHEFDGQLKAKNWGIALGYSYPFSKRTYAYTYASYSELKKTGDDEDTEYYDKTKNTEFGFGLVHKF